MHKTCGSSPHYAANATVLLRQPGKVQPLCNLEVAVGSSGHFADWANGDSLEEMCTLTRDLIATAADIKKNVPELM